MKLDTIMKKEIEACEFPNEITSLSDVLNTLNMLYDVAKRIQEQTSGMFIDVSCTHKKDSESIQFFVSAKRMMRDNTITFGKKIIIIPLAKEKKVRRKRKTSVYEDRRYLRVQDAKGLCVFLVQHGYLQKNNDNTVTIPILWLKKLWNVSRASEMIYIKQLLQEGSFELIKDEDSKRPYHKAFFKVKDLPVTCLRADTSYYDPIKNYLDDILNKHKENKIITKKKNQETDPVYERPARNQSTVNLTKAGKRAVKETPNVYKRCMVCKHAGSFEGKKNATVYCSKYNENKHWSDHCNSFELKEIFQK